MLFAKPLLQAALVVSTTTATNLYVASSDGIVTTLALSGSGNSSSLAITSTSDECSVNPAALNLDHDNRILYCLDRGENKDINGSMNTFSVDADGKLSTRLSRLTVPASGVWAEFVENPAGVRGIATAHFNKSAATIIGISADGGLLGPLQTWFPTVEAPGPFLDRQDRSFLHQVIVDPTGKFVLMLDLGGDRIRVYALNEQTLTPVAELPSLATEPGVGPRHGVFWQCGATGKQYIIFNGELDQKVHSYEVTYTDAGLTWVKVFDIPALGVDGEVPAMTAPTSECALTVSSLSLSLSILRSANGHRARQPVHHHLQP